MGTANNPVINSSNTASTAEATGLPETSESIPAVPVVNRYEAQLAQLHDMGFTDDDYNIVILDSVDGDLEQATNLLFAMRE